MQFFDEEFENEKKNEKKMTSQSGDLNPRFSEIFPPMVWIFMEGEGDEIKPKQASKRDRTLLKVKTWVALKVAAVSNWGCGKLVGITVL